MGAAIRRIFTLILLLRICTVYYRYSTTNRTDINIIRQIVLYDLFFFIKNTSVFCAVSVHVGINPRADKITNHTANLTNAQPHYYSYSFRCNIIRLCKIRSTSDAFGLCKQGISSATGPGTQMASTLCGIGCV